MLARQLSQSGRLSDKDRKSDRTHKEMSRRRVLNSIQKMDKIFRNVEGRLHSVKKTGRYELYNEVCSI